LEHRIPGVLGVREDHCDKLRLLIFELGTCCGRCWRALLRLKDLHQRARIDPQEQDDASQDQEPDASASQRRPGAHATAVLDVRTLLSTSPAHTSLSGLSFRLELVFDAFSAALKEPREVLGPNRDLAQLLCQGSPGLRANVAVDIDTSVFLEVANRIPRSLAHHSVVLSGLVPANVECLLQCCGVVI
jgi:hypothetical protein